MVFQSTEKINAVNVHKTMIAKVADFDRSQDEKTFQKIIPAPTVIADANNILINRRTCLLVKMSTNLLNIQAKRNKINIKRTIEKTIKRIIVPKK